MDSVSHVQEAGTKFQDLPDLVLDKTLSYLPVKVRASLYVAGDERVDFCARSAVLQNASIEELATMYLVGKKYKSNRLKSLCLRTSLLIVQSECDQFKSYRALLSKESLNIFSR